MQCHVQVPGEGSVHHLLPLAQGTDSPLGDPDVGDCTPCHGALVDDIGDGHQIPTYDPSLVTPSASGADGEPLNSRGKGAGACDYCHDSGTDTITGLQVYTNSETHHNTGVFQSETGIINEDACQWCHNMTLPGENFIRTCEGCHGFESLHNIQIDSQPNGQIDIGGELSGYGHIGNNDDCWGCHGFLQATAPGTGPIIPFIGSSDVLSITAGTDTSVILTGVAFTNTYLGIFNWTSNVSLTAADGSTTVLMPDIISEDSLTVTIPGTTVAGNYDIRAVKESTESNPVVISIKPAVTITDVKCAKKRGRLIIRGSGFSEKVEGTDSYINVEVNGEMADIISWSDNRINASVSICSTDANITVNSLFGSATTGDDKPPKPCTGRRCN
jgi:hypothetical protein